MSERFYLDYQAETANAAYHLRDVAPRSVAHANHTRGMRNREPVIVMLDALIAYAKRHEARFESKLAEDYFLGPRWKDAAEGVRALLNGDGDFDGGTCEAMFWEALRIAGFTEKDLGTCDCSDAREATEKRERKARLTAAATATAEVAK